MPVAEGKLLAKPPKFQRGEDGPGQKGVAGGGKRGEGGPGQNGNQQPLNRTYLIFRRRSNLKKKKTPLRTRGIEHHSRMGGRAGKWQKLRKGPRDKRWGEGKRACEDPFGNELFQVPARKRGKKGP